MVADDFLTVDDLANLISSSSKFYIGWYLIKLQGYIKRKKQFKS